MNRRHCIVAGSAAAATLAARGAIAARPETIQPDFQFHSNFWINLHHRLYRQAQLLERMRYGREPVGFEKRIYADINRVAGDQRHTWETALAFYRAKYGRKDFIFDNDLRATDDQLALTDNGRTPEALSLPKPLIAALMSTGPAYRTTFWKGDDSTNRVWIGAAKRSLATYGMHFSSALPRIFQSHWMSLPYRVDVMPDSSFPSSYSTYGGGGPLQPYWHIVVSSADPDNGGLGDMETLFHEASHSIVWQDGGPVGSVVSRAAKRAGRPEPPDLWHVVIFYTVGSLAHAMYRRRGLAYTMFAVRAGLFKRFWPSYYAPLARYWQPYMDGKGTFEPALTKCVDAIVGV